MSIYRKLRNVIIIIFAVATSMPAYALDSASILHEIQRDDWEVRLMRGDTFEKIKDPQSTKTLIDLIEDQRINWRLQIRGIRVLAEIHTPLAEDALLKLFTDVFYHHACPAVKSSLATALGNFSGPKVAAGLIGGLDDPELQVREASIVSLGRVGDASAVPYLIAQLNDKSFVIKVSAIHSLGLLKDPSAAYYLKEIADNDSDLILKREARAALSMIRT